MIEFSLDARSGLSPYLQVVQQVRHALRLGLLCEGDQLPTVKAVVARLAINPNTVLKTYRELERDGLVAARAGVGTFVTRTLTDTSLGAHDPLRRELGRWLARRTPPASTTRASMPCSPAPSLPRSGHSVTAILRTEGLGKRYRRRWALADCTLEIPPGHVTGLVGPNGAGKTTLLGLAVGMLTPTAGSIGVGGVRPAAGAAQLAKVGYVARDTPTYAGLTVADHLRLRAHLNPRWDDAVARSRVDRIGLDPAQKAGRLSGVQRAQLALTLDLAKRPDLLILDEPVASLDPLARREFLQALMEAVAEHEVSVVLSSHVVSDLERVCDHLVVLVESRVRVEGEVEHLLGTHFRLTGPLRNPAALPHGQHVVHPAVPIGRAHSWSEPKSRSSIRRGRSAASASRTSSWRT